MYGYIYKVTNKTTGKVYIGKHLGDKFDQSYYGSGKEIIKDVESLGKDQFERELICTAEDRDTLNQLEQENISKAFEETNGNIYNQASGGDGGDVFRYASDEVKRQFVEKMTKINRERCGSEEFRRATGIRMREKYSDPEERRILGEKVRKTWNTEKMKQEQSQRLKEFYKTHTCDKSHQFKKTRLTINGEERVFECQKDALSFLKSEWHIDLGRPDVKRIKQLTSEGKSYRPRKYNKFAGLNSIQIETIQKGSVETKGDECNPVGQK